MFTRTNGPIASQSMVFRIRLMQRRGGDAARCAGRVRRGAASAAPRLVIVTAYGVPLSTAWPISWTRPRPGRPAAALTADADVGPMQKSDASVGFDWWLTGRSTCPVAFTVLPIVPLVG